MLQELGPTGVTLGQMVASRAGTRRWGGRPSWPGWEAELAKLQSRRADPRGMTHRDECSAENREQTGRD